MAVYWHLPTRGVLICRIATFARVEQMKARSSSAACISGWMTLMHVPVVSLSLSPLKPATWRSVMFLLQRAMATIAAGCCGKRCRHFVKEATANCDTVTGLFLD